jgi:hypothetical protein
MRNIPEILICMLVVVAMLGPATGFADSLEVATPAVTQAVDPGAEIAKAIEEVAKSMDHIDAPDDTTAMALMIPILGILGVFFAPMLVVIVIVWLAYRHRNQKEQRNHETIRQMIEKGMEIPPNISFGEAPAEGAPLLRRGLTLVGVGLGLVCFFFMMGLGGIAGVGAIPLFIGLAYLLIWHLEKKQIQSAN